MEQVQINGCSIAYNVAGEGIPIVFVGGLGMPKEGWYFQVQYFKNHFKTVVFDNRGTGESDSPNGPYSIEQMGKDVLRLLDHLGLTEVHLVGASMGGFICLQLALHHSERVISVTICNSAAFIPEKSRALLQLWQKFEKQGVPLEIQVEEQMQWIYPETFYIQKNQLEMIRQQMILGRKSKCMRGYDAQLEACLQFDISARLKEVTLPLLVVSTSDDLICPHHYSKSIYKIVPHSEYLLYQNGGHCLHVCLADQLNKDLHQFIKKLKF